MPEEGGLPPVSFLDNISKSFIVANISFYVVMERTFAQVNFDRCYDNHSCGRILCFIT